MRQCSACLVVNRITVHSYVFLFNCTPQTRFFSLFFLFNILPRSLYDFMTGSANIELLFSFYFYFIFFFIFFFFGGGDLLAEFLTK